VIVRTKLQNYINRLSIKYLCFVLLLSYLPISAQITHLKITQLQVKVTINSNETNAKAIIENFEKKYGINFSYSDNILENIILPIKSEQQLPLKDFMTAYLEPAGISYKVIGSQIVLFVKEIPTEWFIISGYIKDAINSEDIIGATIFVNDLGIGTITNPYGFYSLKLRKGKYKISFSSLGYHQTVMDINLNYHYKNNLRLNPISYEMNEVVISNPINSIFLEATLMNLVKIDIKSLQDLPVLFGENDAISNLAVLPGIQANELSTSSISVRGGGPDQTTFLVDEANLYNASHFGGFFSIFNPDVVNSVNVYKSDIPVSEGGALASIIDVHLREGNNKQWQVKGGIGLISARLAVEGPLKKEKSSMLFAVRRTFVDDLSKVLATDSDLSGAKFYFYDANFKLNYTINDNNRVFLSGYTGSDVFSQYSQISSVNYLGSARWNHLFNSRLFTNSTVSLSQNTMKQGTQEGKELLYWESKINNFKFKSDISYVYSEAFKCTFGYSGTVYNIYPYSLLTQTEKTLLIRYQSANDQMMLNSLYYNQQLVIGNKLGIDAGFRFTHLLTYPFSDSLVGVSDLYLEPQLRLSYAFNSTTTIKWSISQQVQPLHQLPISMVGIAINRWMPANKSFMPQKSTNYTLGFYDEDIKGVNFSTEVYYRKMENLIETLQDLRILYTDNPDNYLYNASGTVYGFEMFFSYNIDNFKGLISYDYCKPLWKTETLNNQKPYEPSHTRKHSLNLTGVYKINHRISASATWIFASGIPYSAANGMYELNGNTYLQFNNDKINTKKLPPYHRLDISVDVAGKKNEIRRWQSFWNFSVYNVYFRKNALGIAYFIPEDENGNAVQTLNPGFFYLYQFVPSVSYRFEF